MVKKVKNIKNDSMMTRKISRATGAGLAIPAGIILGIGVGLLLDNVAPYMFIGLGLGFVVFLILRMVGK